MTQTIVSSHKQEVVIGFDRPFCVIGERINPTGRKRLAAEMSAGDYSTVEADALAQVQAGAHMLDGHFFRVCFGAPPAVPDPRVQTPRRGPPH